MEITHEHKGSITIISVVGSLDAATAPQLNEFLNQRIGDGCANLVLDLARLNYTSSAGLRVILSAAKGLRQRGGDLRLAALQPNVNKVFELSGFTSVLKFYADAAAAVASFST